MGGVFREAANRVQSRQVNAWLISMGLVAHP
jgi:hypothetical protein